MTDSIEIENVKASERCAKVGALHVSQLWDLDSVFPRLVQAALCLAAAAPPPGMILAEYCMVITLPLPLPYHWQFCIFIIFKTKTILGATLLVFS